MPRHEIILPGRRGLELYEELIFKRSEAGRIGIELAKADIPQLSDEEIAALLGPHQRTAKDAFLLPECSEPELVRHYTRLSRQNFAIDLGSYPLGSCTMKYNPKINEWAARLPGFASLHPYEDERDLQEAFAIMWDLQGFLGEIGGFHEVSLMPSAGAHGEFVGLSMIDLAIKAKNESRHTIMVPESAHGTNPATASFFQYKVAPITMNPCGRINLDDVRKAMNEQCAGIMLTNPNTLGIFESDVKKIADIIHSQGGYVYGDGANLNALMGLARPGDLGIDVMHFNLHKTMTTPHGGGGPGCGAVGASSSLSPFLPGPIIGKLSNGFTVLKDRPKSMGRIRSFYSNFGMMVRAWCYIRTMGGPGLKKASELAVLNANYIKACLKPYYYLPFQSDCLHEVVLSDRKQQAFGIRALDIAKRLIDFGIHPPTIYFPLVVPGALMIEPTETETKKDLDILCEAFIRVAQEAEENPQIVKSAPHNTAMKRLDEAKAARLPILSYQDLSRAGEL